MKALVLYATDEASTTSDAVATRRAANSCFSMGMDVVYHRTDVASAYSAAYIDNIVADHGCDLVVCPFVGATAYGAFQNFAAGELANGIPVFLLNTSSTAVPGQASRDGTSSNWEAEIISTGGIIYTGSRHYTLSSETLPAQSVGLVRRTDTPTLHSTWKYTPDGTTWVYIDNANNAYPLLHLMVQEAYNDGAIGKPPIRFPIFLNIDHINATGDGATADTTAGTTGQPSIIQIIGDILRDANGVVYASFEQGDMATMVAQQKANMVEYADVFKWIATHDHSLLDLTNGTYTKGTATGDALYNQESTTDVLASNNATETAIEGLGLEVNQDFAHFAGDRVGTNWHKLVEEQDWPFLMCRVGQIPTTTTSYPMLNGKDHHWLSQKTQFGGMTMGASVDAGVDNGAVVDLALDIKAFQRNLRPACDGIVYYHHDTDFENPALNVIDEKVSDDTFWSRGKLAWTTGAAYQIACPDTVNFGADVLEYSSKLIRRGTKTASATWVDPGIIFSATDFELDTPQYMALGTTLTGIAAAKVGLISFWIKPESIPASGMVISTQGARFQVFIRTNNTIRVSGKNAANGQVLTVTTSGTASLATWTHFACSYDLSDGAKQFVYLDGAADAATWATYVNDTIDYNRSDWSISATEAGLTPIDGCVSEVYFTNEYLDLSANIDKFISGGSPVYCGATGQLPTGTAALIYQQDPAASFGNNRGSGGDFTITNGPLSDCSDTP